MSREYLEILGRNVHQFRLDKGISMDAATLVVQAAKFSTAFFGYYGRERQGATYLTDTLHTRPVIVVFWDR